MAQEVVDEKDEKEVADGKDLKQKLVNFIAAVMHPSDTKMGRGRPAGSGATPLKKPRKEAPL